MDESTTDEEHILAMLEGGDRGLIDEFVETSDSLGFGSPREGQQPRGGFGGNLWIDRGAPMGWRDNKPFPLHPRSEFRAERFDVAEKRAGLARVLGQRRIRRGVAIWFRHATDPLQPDDQWLCGWVHREREDEALGWARQLNRLVQQNLGQAGASSSETEATTPASGAVSGLSLGELSDFKALFKDPDCAAGPTTTAIGVEGPTVRIARHAAGRQPCVSLITDGLQRLGREELVLTVSDRVLAKASSAPAEVLKAIADAIDNGPPLLPGAILGARHPAWPRLAGFALERASPQNGVDLPAGSLALHALVDQELDAAKEFGPLRVIARLARQAGAWPPPETCDPWRPAVATPSERTLLREVRTAHVPGITVALELARSMLMLRVSRTILPMIADLDVSRDLALFASLDNEADALLAWQPGDATAHANAGGRSSPKRIAGCFFAVTSKARTDAIGPIEDGFSALLTPASAAKLGAALRGGQPVELRPANGLGLVVQWSGDRAVEN